ncbi:MAG: dephospho-CoA kinase [Fusobacterium sp.]|uniref:dephospho-CoA kinase n=1 Tax=Fusobacterium sp. TaxID=68766 RepID=UPI0026DD7E5D|nr:dephospho-CoA kinase [Fusobacterium sp.]MDO4690858.1 dephospho-CoA kinase [Fusobacterium sp.]
MIIGLTGGIASGKTTVSKILKTKGFLIYDADEIAREISKEEEVKKELISYFGEQILDKASNIDRKKLKDIVFKDKEKLEELNRIIHPRVYVFFKSIREKNDYKKTIVFDVPLLFESGIDKLCDKILLVLANRELKIKRIIKRDGISKELAEKIIGSQMSDDEKIKKADIIIKNNDSIEDLKEQVERFCVYL